MSNVIRHIIQERIMRSRVSNAPRRHVVSDAVVRHLVDTGIVPEEGGATTPVNTVAPSITSLETGVLAVASAGTWTDAITVTGDWIVDGVSQGATYTPAASDAGLDAFYRETAVNGAESATADSAAVTITYNPVVIPDVVEWVTVRKASGYAQDDSVQPLPGVIAGYDFYAQTLGQAALYEDAAIPGAKFDGSDDLMEHALASNFNFLHAGASTMVLVFDSVYGQNQYLWTSGNTSANGVGVAILLTSTSIRYYLTNGSGTHIYLRTHAYTLTAGKHTLAFAQDATDLRIYVDGALVDTSSPSGGAYNSGDSTYNPRFSNTFYQMDGVLTDAVFASAKLSASEILQLHNNLS